MLEHMLEQTHGSLNGPTASGPVGTVGVRACVVAVSSLDRGVGDGERVEQLRALEDLKAAACAAQARIAVALADSHAASQADSRADAQADSQTNSRASSGAVSRGGVGAQIALARRESPHRGGRLLGLAQALVTEMPHTLHALETGDLNEWRATLIVRETACVTAEDRVAIDAELWAHPDRVTSLGDRALVAKVKTLAYRADPHSVVNRATRAHSERFVSLRPAPDTMTYLTALLPVTQGVAAYAALSRAADTTQAAGGDPRGRGQVMADTLVERLTGQTHVTEVGVQVNLVMTDTTLLGGDPEPAIISGHGPIPAQVSRDLVTTAADQGRAWFRRLYQHPTTKRLIGMESRARLFPKALGEFIEVRDQTCRTPWCDAPIRHHDHVLPHAQGGPTAAVNAQGLCEACNHIKQTTGWQARPGPDGDLITTTPTGHTYTSPEPQPPGSRPPQQKQPRRPIDYDAA